MNTMMTKSATGGRGMNRVGGVVRVGQGVRGWQCDCDLRGVVEKWHWERLC
jgi:hypothetical protein